MPRRPASAVSPDRDRAPDVCKWRAVGGAAARAGDAGPEHGGGEDAFMTKMINGHRNRVRDAIPANVSGDQASGGSGGGHYKRQQGRVR